MKSCVLFLLLLPFLVKGEHAGFDTDRLADNIKSGNTTLDMEEPKNSETCNTASLFARIENGLRNPKYGHQKVPFRKSNTNRELPIPDFVSVFEIYGDAESYSLGDLAKSARNVIDDNLPSSGAVLFRNLHHTIESVSDFKEFWTGVMESEQKGDWTNFQRDGHNKERMQLSGVDTATSRSNPMNILLYPHNEMVYNPNNPSKIAFYCLHEGIGGETLLATNRAISKNISDDVKNFIKSHGGIHYFRYYFSDADSKEPPLSSWQGKTGATTREEATQYFVDRGWKEEDISFDHHGEMKVSFVHPGYIMDEETGEELWFNALGNVAWPMADGTKIPREIYDQIVEATWQSTSSFPLQQGDWLVMDNKRVMHGRFPYEEISPEMPRILLVVYTE